MSERPNEDAQAEYLRTHADTAKPSNPKDAFGSAKVPVGLAPDTAITEMALAFLEGALKYGRYNWRVVGVRASIYNDAMDRHRKKWWNGQDRDPSTKVRELASVMACCAILIDSEICGVLEDDRPPMAPLGPQLDENMAVVAHLKELFKEHSPAQFTWADSPQIKALNESMQAGIADALREPEGFPGGYELAPGTTLAEVPGTSAAPHPGRPGTLGMCAVEDCYAERELYSINCALHRELPMVPDIGASDMPGSKGQGPLLLDCGCVKRCKGHTEPNFRAAPVSSSPGNYAQERAAGSYRTETADAEFPLAPPIHRPVEAAREFDPAD